MAEHAGCRRVCAGRGLGTCLLVQPPVAQAQSRSYCPPFQRRAADPPQHVPAHGRRPDGPHRDPPPGHRVRCRQAGVPRTVTGTVANRVCRSAPGAARLEPAADPLDRLIGLGQQAGERVPDVRHQVPDFQRDIDPGGTCLRGEPGRVVKDHLSAAGLDQDRRQPVQAGVQRRGIRMPGNPRRPGTSPRFRASRPAGSSHRHPRVDSDSPVSARSVQGDIATAAAGSGSPASRSATSVARARPPPAESPAIAASAGSSWRGRRGHVPR